MYLCKRENRILHLYHSAYQKVFILKLNLPYFEDLTLGSGSVTWRRKWFPETHSPVQSNQFICIAHSTANSLYVWMYLNSNVIILICLLIICGLIIASCSVPLSLSYWAKPVCSLCVCPWCMSQVWATGNQPGLCSEGFECAVHALGQPHAEALLWNISRYTSTSSWGVILASEKEFREELVPAGSGWWFGLQRSPPWFFMRISWCCYCRPMRAWCWWFLEALRSVPRDLPPCPCGIHDALISLAWPPVW